MNGAVVVFTFIGVVTLLVGAGILTGGVLFHRRHRRILTHGLEARGVCLDTYTRRSGEHTSREAVISFRTPEGREVRFVERASQAVRVAGDSVVVRYEPDRPEQAIPVDAGAGGTCLLWFAGFFGLAFAAFGVVALVIGYAMADRSEDPQPPDHGPVVYHPLP
ncbi:DUF3592 domain-containing protein [Kitasatospora sp. NPDC004240]